MPFLIRPATEADSPSLAKLSREAFRPGIGQLMYPPRLSHRTLDNTPPDAEGAPFMDEWTWQLQRAQKRMNTTTTVVLVDTDLAKGVNGEEEEEEEEILGFAQWVPPRGSPYFKEQEKSGEDGGNLKKDENRPVVAPVPPTFDRDRDRQIEEEFEAETKRTLGEDGYKNMWYLEVLCVHPNHQGKGVGKKLLQWGMARAAEEQKALFLLASTEGFPLYRSQGFQTIGEFHLCGVLHSRSMILPAPYPTLDPATVLDTEVVIDGECS